MAKKCGCKGNWSKKELDEFVKKCRDSTLLLSN